MTPQSFRRTLSHACLMLSMVVAASCGDSSSGTTEPNGSSGDLFIRFDANGTRVTVAEQQTSLQGAFSHSGNQYGALILGTNANGRAVSLLLFSATQVGVGTYSGYTVAGAALVGAQIVYTNDAGVVFTSNTGPGTDVSVTIQSITATTVTGTFSGQLKSATGSIVAATNGQFAVHRAN